MVHSNFRDILSFFSDKNMVAKYQEITVAKYKAKYQGISRYNVWDASVRLQLRYCMFAISLELCGVEICMAYRVKGLVMFY